jgi:hypothetical protein
MFLSNDYVLSNEIVEKSGIHIANISMGIKLLEDSNAKAGAVVKYGNCTFLNKNAKTLPLYLKNYIHNPQWTFTDFSNKLPVTFLQAELGVPFKDIQEGFKKEGTDISVQEIAGKQFAVFPKEFAEKMKKTTWYMLNEEEFKSCLRAGDIDGGFKVKKGKFLSWY